MSNRYELNEQLDRLRAELAKLGNDLSLPAHAAPMLYGEAVREIGLLRSRIQGLAVITRASAVRDEP